MSNETTILPYLGMGSESDILASFTSNVCNNFCRKCPLRRCTLVRRCKARFESDFSLPLEARAWKRHISLGNYGISDVTPNTTGENNEPDCKLQNKTCEVTSGLQTLLLRLESNGECGNSCSSDSDLDVDTVSQDLIDRSKSWALVIRRCTLQHGKLLLYLERTHAFKTVLESILSQGQEYGYSPTKSQNIVLTADIPSEDHDVMDLSQFRMHILKDVLHNLLAATGYNVLQDSDAARGEQLHVHLSTRSTSNIPLGCVRILCGVVVGSVHGTKECEVLAKDYLRQRKEDLETMCGEQEGQEVDQSEAAVRVELLMVRPFHTVWLNVHPYDEGGHSTGRKGRASFFLYNCARIAALRRQFEKLVAKGEYPALVPLDEVDFSLLTNEEEWNLLVHHLLGFPGVLQSCVEDIAQGRARPNLLCEFLGVLCNKYSIYYKYVRLLTPPEEHLLPTMNARLYLLQGIECVLHNTLRILGIKPVTQM